MKTIQLEEEELDSLKAYLGQKMNDLLMNIQLLEEKKYPENWRESCEEIDDEVSFCHRILRKLDSAS